MAQSSGGPGLWPQLIAESFLPTAMKFEQTGWNVAALTGSTLGGALVMVLPLAWVAGITSVVFLASAVNLSLVSMMDHQLSTKRPTLTVRPSTIIFGDVRLWGPLIVFWMSNIGGGVLMVVEPLMVQQWRATGVVYGLLGALGAIMATVGAWFWPGRPSHRPLLHRVLLMEVVAGITMWGYWWGIAMPFWAFFGAGLSAGLAGGTSVMVMQLRFNVLDVDLRPIVLTYLRMLLQAAGPIGAVLAGAFLQHHGLKSAIMAVVTISIVPSVVLLISPHVRHGDRVSVPTS